MRKAFLVSLSLTLVLLLLAPATDPTDIRLNNAPTQSFFSPKGGCTDAIVKAINNGKSEILVQAYSFTSAPIAKALVASHKRNVKVEAILDESQRSEKYASAAFWPTQGYPPSLMPGAP
jgi:phosphatidylserine/phosphatidylglycerophosphate/cardiolipin synthase-like enzyme